MSAARWWSAMGEKEHGRIQRTLIRYLAQYRPADLGAWPEQRIQINPAHYHLHHRGRTRESDFYHPPLVCVEILSRNDTVDQLQEVIDDYLKIGMPYCWVINPWKRIANAASPTGFEKLPDGVFRTTAPHPELTNPLDELFGL